MRRLAYPAAILLLLASATVANAGAGLPKLATLEAGGYKAAVHIDSQVPHVGTNVLTIESSSLPGGAHVELSLIGPDGQTVSVPLKPLVVLTGPEGGHGGEAADSHAAPTADSHAAPAADSHGADHAAPKTDSHGTASDGHGAAAESNAHGGESTAAAGYNARGKAQLNQTGHWTAVLVIDGVPEGKLTAKAPFEVEQGGPNRIFLAFSGLLMGGTMIYGAVNRRSHVHKGR